MKFFVIVFTALLTLQATNTIAAVSVLPDKVSDAELARLPDFCKVRMKTPWDSLESRAWRSKIGENYGDFFHYCAGLNYVNRYWGARDAKARGYYLGRADANFTYIVRAIKPDFTMGAELFTNRGEVYKLMGKTGDAIKDLRQAISIAPTFVQAYLKLADVYVGSGDQLRALEVVGDGLRHVSGSTALQRRYLELGGKEPFPKPPAKETVDKAPEPASLQESNPLEAPVEGRSEPGTLSGSQPVIGTPKNPHCRFCPPE